MLKYSLKRLMMVIPIMLGIIILVFAFRSVLPGDVVELLTPPNATEQQRVEMREELGLDDPLPVQFGNYLFDVIRGDLGTSYITKRPVLRELLIRFPVTASIVFSAVFLAVLIGVPLGVISALKQYSLWDNVIIIISMALISVPPFVLALIGIYVFSVNLGWLPAAGIGSSLGYILPILVIALTASANYMRITRSSVLEVMREDYVRTARAKGQVERVITIKHILRNALIPVAANIGNQIGVRLGGALIIETIFGLPGVGKYISDAIFTRDYPVVLGGVIFLGFVFTIINLLVDLSYVAIDPRLKKTLLMKKSKKKSLQ